MSTDGTRDLRPASGSWEERHGQTSNLSLPTSAGPAGRASEPREGRLSWRVVTVISGYASRIRSRESRERGQEARARRCQTMDSSGTWELGKGGSRAPSPDRTLRTGPPTPSSSTVPASIPDCGSLPVQRRGCLPLTGDGRSHSVSTPCAVAHALPRGLPGQRTHRVSHQNQLVVETGRHIVGLGHGAYHRRAITRDHPRGEPTQPRSGSRRSATSTKAGHRSLRSDPRGGRCAGPRSCH